MTAINKQADLTAGAPGEASSLASPAGAGASTDGSAVATEVARAFIFSARWVERDSVTPAAQVEAGILLIARTWNESIPVGRVRILTTPRMIEVIAVLRVFTPDQVCDAIEFYGGQAWQRSTGKWKRYDNWMTVQVVTQWIEAEADAREAPARDADRRARMARQHHETAAAKRAESDSQLARRARFKALPPEVKNKYLTEARKRLGAAGRCSEFMLTMSAITIMDETEEGGKDTDR